MTAGIEQLLRCVPAFSGDETSTTETEGDRLESLMKDAFESPINYPAISESIFPGDRVTILVQDQLPAAKDVLESLIRVLESSRIETENVLIVVPPSMSRAFDLQLISGDAAKQSNVPSTYRMKDDSRNVPLTFEIHDDENENAASYLAANEQGNPVYVNRSLCDSDVILPLCCLSPGAQNEDCLYPEFSTADTKDRFRSKLDSKSQRQLEAMLANDSLGLFFSIELICRPGEVIEQIICGERNQVRQEALEILETLWCIEAPLECDVVVTTIESCASAATWKDVIRAVNTAATFSADGPIVVWTELSQRPTAKVKTACAAQFEGSIPDSLSTKMQHFASTLCERPVYLRSQLSQNVVESLGLGHVESAQSVERILRPCSSPMLIRDGHLRVVAKPEPSV